MNKRFYLLLLLGCVWLTPSQAQLSFPKGKVLNVYSNIEFMYWETAIYFHTGANKVSDYNWVKGMSDSLDPRWDFQACMNGDCKVGLPAQGAFTTAFGENDTTGFIRCHIATAGKNGASWFTYIVAHKTDTSDHAELRFNVFYENLTGVNEANRHDQLHIFPNPATGQLHLYGVSDVATYQIVSINGQQVVAGNLNGNRSESIDIGMLSNGMYILNIQGDGPERHQLFQISNQ